MELSILNSFVTRQVWELCFLEFLEGESKASLFLATLKKKKRFSSFYQLIRMLELLFPGNLQAN